MAGEGRTRLIQAKQEILGDMHYVHAIYEIELPCPNALSVPWQIEVQRGPFQRQI